MSENIKFTKDAASYDLPWQEVYGGYEADDTGVLVDFVQDNTGQPFAVVRLTSTNKYIFAPVSDIEYVPEEP